jgi:hypothetical protein
MADCLYASVEVWRPDHPHDLGIRPYHALANTESLANAPLSVKSDPAREIRLCLPTMNDTLALQMTLFPIACVARS